MPSSEVRLRGSACLVWPGLELCCGNILSYSHALH